MKKKLLSLMLCTALTAALLAGCGKGGGEETGAAAPAAEDAGAAQAPETEDNEAASADSGADSADAAAAEGEPVTLTIMSTIQTENEAPLEKALADAYMEANPNVRIEFVEQTINDLPAKIIAMNTSGDLPDAFYMPTEFMPQSKSMGIIMDPTEYLGDDFLNSIDPAVIEYGTMDGQLMVVPWFMVPQALIYRADWLEEAGMDTIESMDDFIKAAQAFTNGSDRWGFAMVGTQNGSGEGRYVQFSRAFGVDEIYQDAEGKWVSDLTTDKYKEALQTFVDMDLKHGTVPPGASETGYPEAVTFFAQEQAGLMISGSNAIGAIISQNPELDGKLGSVPIPKAERHCTNLQVSGYAITTACEHPQEMADYLKFLTEYENAVSFAKETGRMPVTKDAMGDEMFQDKAYKGFVDCVQYALPYPAYSGYTEILDIMGESYNSMLSGVSIDDAMNQVKTRTETLLKETQE